jgi:hypothetical protein
MLDFGHTLPRLRRRVLRDLKPVAEHRSGRLAARELSCPVVLAAKARGGAVRGAAIRVLKVGCAG